MKNTTKLAAALVLILGTCVSAGTALDFSGWDHGAITGGGQVFTDICGDIDVTVTAEGVFDSDSTFALTTAGGETAIRSEHVGAGEHTFIFEFSDPIDLELDMRILDQNEVFTVTTNGTESYMHMSGSMPTVTAPYATAFGSGIQVEGASFGLDSLTGASSGLVKASGVTSLAVSYESLNVAGIQYGEFQITKVVPEPGSLPLLGMGILGLVNGFRRRRRSAC